MQMVEKIVVIGAGSAMFIREVMGELTSRNWEAEVALVDVNPDALVTAQRLAKKMVAYRGSPVRVTATTNRRRALKNATAVICTIGVGGRRAWSEDVLIARRHGVYMPVGDTAGPAGTARAMRMIPVMVDIAREVGELAPNAVLFNHSNPMAAICRAIDKAAGLKAVGLCHAVNDTGRYLRETLAAAPDEFAATACGISHLT
jgi:alpha-galactosidase